MTSHVARLYVAAGSLLVFFLAWAGIAAHPWSSGSAITASSTSTQALAAYEERLRYDAVLLSRLSTRRAQVPAAAPQVRVVTLPPLTITRTS